MQKKNLREFVGDKQGKPFYHDKNGIRDWLRERAIKAKECGLRNIMYFDPTDEQYLKKVD